MVLSPMLGFQCTLCVRRRAPFAHVVMLVAHIGLGVHLSVNTDPTAGVLTASLLTGMLTGTIPNKSLAVSTVALSTAPAGAIILHAGDNVSAIVNAAPVGATFFFEPGIYRGVSITPKTGQTFIGAEGAILNGSAVLTNSPSNGNFWSSAGRHSKVSVNSHRI